MFLERTLKIISQIRGCNAPDSPRYERVHHYIQSNAPFIVREQVPIFQGLPFYVKTPRLQPWHPA